MRDEPVGKEMDSSRDEQGGPAETCQAVFFETKDFGAHVPRGTGGRQGN